MSRDHVDSEKRHNQANLRFLTLETLPLTKLSARSTTIMTKSTLSYSIYRPLKCVQTIDIYDETRMRTRCRKII